MSEDSERRLLTFRRQLLRLSESLSEDEVEKMKYIYYNRMPRKTYLRIKEGYQLFTYLEQKELLTTNHYQVVLRNLCSACERDADKEVSDFDRGMRSFLPLRLEANVDITTEKKASGLEVLFRKCMTEISDSLAREDGSLQKLIYVCPCLRLKDIERLKDGFSFVTSLEKAGVLCCWKLSYLFTMFRMVERFDLCHKLQFYTRLARVHMPTEFSPDLHKPSNGYVRSVSEPARLPTATCLSTYHTSGVMSSVDTYRSLTQPEADSATVVLPAETGEESAPSTVPNEPYLNAKLSIFEHPVYCCLNSALCFPGVYHVLVSVMVLTCILSFVKFPLEWMHCGPATAIMNLASKLLTHNILPFYVISTLPNITGDNRVKQCRFFSQKPRKEVEEVLTSVVKKLSTGAEWEELVRVQAHPVQKVNSLLRKKLTFVTATSLAQSATFTTSIFLIISANWSTFTGLTTDTFARLYCFVMIVTSLVILGSVTLGLSLYLFEMRVCEYLMYVIHCASKKKAREVVRDAKQVKQVLETRWSGFSKTIVYFTLTYVAILCCSVYFQAPFRCSGGTELNFSREDVIDIPSSWLCWILVGLLGQLLVCWYRVFVHGRIVAIVVQILFVFFLMYQRLEGQHLKWAGLLQIIHVLYPLAYGLSVFYVNCCHTWTKTMLWSKSVHYVGVFRTVICKSTYFVNFFMLFLTSVVAVYVLCLEYNSFHVLSVR